MEEIIRFELNGKNVEVQIEPSRTLLWVLRDRFDLTGTKFGCGIGYCNSCTVMMDAVPVASCQIPMESIQGRKILTIEGLSRDGAMHPLQEAFVKHDALQCGYCTSGMIMRAYGLLQQNPRPSRQDIMLHMDRNLCRCGAHTRILDAIQTASAEMKGEKQP